MHGVMLAVSVNRGNCWIRRSKLARFARSQSPDGRYHRPNRTDDESDAARVVPRITCAVAKITAPRERRRPAGRLLPRRWSVSCERRW
jgi:hypothetical protein